MVNLKVNSQTPIDSRTTIAQLVTILLKNRGLTKDTAANFLKPLYPDSIVTVDQAIVFIKQAIKDHRKILIYGDYDVDGVTSTSILYLALKNLNADVTAYLPHREKDGYGFRAKSFFHHQQGSQARYDLLITVDNGIVANQEFAKVKKKQNIDIIVIDHHLPADLQDLKSNVQHLIYSPDVCAAALSWFVSKKLDKNASLGLAALGTVADCLPLIGINRQIVVHGLQSLRLDPPLGFKKLCEIGRIKLGSLSTYDLGFVIGPRINAVGRLDSPQAAFELLTSSDHSKVSQQAASLNNFNQDRQLLQKESLDLASSQRIGAHKVIIVAHDTFHPGIIGLLAGRLTEKHYLPSVIIAIDGKIAKGSCRSIPELNIIDTLRQYKELFVDVGGHAGAAGFTILTKDIPKLKKMLTAHIDGLLKDIDLNPTLEVDAQMKLSAVTVKNYNVIEKLAPFGLGNPQPLFLFQKVKIVSKKVVGSTGDHLSLKLDDPVTPNRENTSCSAIAFKKGELDGQLKVGDLVDIVASLDINHWQGYNLPQLIVKEIILD